MSTAQNQSLDLWREAATQETNRLKNIFALATAHLEEAQTSEFSRLREKHALEIRDLKREHQDYMEDQFAELQHLNRKLDHQRRTLELKEHELKQEVEQLHGKQGIMQQRSAIFNEVSPFLPYVPAPPYPEANEGPYSYNPQKKREDWEKSWRDNKAEELENEITEYEGVLLRRQAAEMLREIKGPRSGEKAVKQSPRKHSPAAELNILSEEASSLLHSSGLQIPNANGTMTKEAVVTAIDAEIGRLRSMIDSYEADAHRPESPVSSLPSRNTSYYPSGSERNGAKFVAPPPTSSNFPITAVKVTVKEVRDLPKDCTFRLPFVKLSMRGHKFETSAATYGTEWDQSFLFNFSSEKGTATGERGSVLAAECLLEVRFCDVELVGAEELARGWMCLEDLAIQQSSVGSVIHHFLPLSRPRDGTAFGRLHLEITIVDFDKRRADKNESEAESADDMYKYWKYRSPPREKERNRYELYHTGEADLRDPVYLFISVKDARELITFVPKSAHEVEHLAEVYCGLRFCGTEQTTAPKRYNLQNRAVVWNETFQFDLQTALMSRRAGGEVTELDLFITMYSNVTKSILCQGMVPIPSLQLYNGSMEVWAKVTGDNIPSAHYDHNSDVLHPCVTLFCEATDADKHPVGVVRDGDMWTGDARFRKRVRSRPAAVSSSSSRFQLEEDVSEPIQALRIRVIKAKEVPVGYTNVFVQVAYLGVDHRTSSRVVQDTRVEWGEFFDVDVRGVNLDLTAVVISLLASKIEATIESPGTVTPLYSPQIEHLGSGHISLNSLHLLGEIEEWLTLISADRSRPPPELLVNVAVHHSGR